MSFIDSHATGRKVLTERKDSLAWLRSGIPILAAGFVSLALAGCGSGPLATLLIEPDDGRAPILQSIAGAKNNVRLTIYELTDLQSVSQSPAAPPDSFVQALMDKTQRGGGC